MTGSADCDINHCPSFRSVFRSDALNILEVAEEMGLTGREYVWILSATALGDRSVGDVASSALPLGLFGE